MFVAEPFVLLEVAAFSKDFPIELLFESIKNRVCVCVCLHLNTCAHMYTHVHKNHTHLQVRTKGSAFINKIHWDILFLKNGFCSLLF
jgi:hypothetical protein